LVRNDKRNSLIIYLIFTIFWEVSIITDRRNTFLRVCLKNPALCDMKSAWFKREHFTGMLVKTRTGGWGMGNEKIKKGKIRNCEC